LHLCTLYRLIPDIVSVSLQTVIQQLFPLTYSN
jgi:hypothetical protein